MWKGNIVQERSWVDHHSGSVSVRSFAVDFGWSGIMRSGSVSKCLTSSN